LLLLLSTPYYETLWLGGLNISPYLATGRKAALRFDQHALETGDLLRGLHGLHGPWSVCSSWVQLSQSLKRWSYLL